MNVQPYVLGIGGTTREGSSTEAALRICLEAALRQGARTCLVSGRELRALPIYDPQEPAGNGRAERLITETRRADGVLLASPAYHGSVSGLMKNAFDYLEGLRNDDRPYLTDRVVGCVALGGGWQGSVATLAALRSIVHALRGAPTSLGVSINTSETPFEADGGCNDLKVFQQLEIVGREVADGARQRLRLTAPEAA